MMGSYVGSGVSQMIMAAPFNMPQVNNFYNQGSNYGQAPQYGQGQTQNYGYSAPSVNNYPPAPQQDYGYSAPQQQQQQTYSYPPAPQQGYSYPTAQGQGYNYNANVPIANVYNQVQTPRYNNHNNGKKDYANLPAPRPYNHDNSYAQGTQMSPEFIKGFMMASLGMGMLAGQVTGNQYDGNGYGMGDAYCPPGMKKPSYDFQKPYRPKPNSYGDGPVLKNTPRFEADTENFGEIFRIQQRILPQTDQQAVEEMSQMFFFFLMAASQGESIEAPQLQQAEPQQEQAGFPFPPGLLQLIQGYMN